MNMVDLPLPTYKHLPGINPRPQDEVLERVATHESAGLFEHASVHNIPWLYGIRLFNEGYFWEAHEVLESVWHLAPPNSRERYLVQCIIQISNAQLKVVLGKPNAAKRLKALAESCRLRVFANTSSQIMGVDSTALQTVVQHCDTNKRGHFLELN